MSSATTLRKLDLPDLVFATLRSGIDPNLELEKIKTVIELSINLIKSLGITSFDIIDVFTGIRPNITRQDLEKALIAVLEYINTLTSNCTISRASIEFYKICIETSDFIRLPGPFIFKNIYYVRDETISYDISRGKEELEKYKKEYGFSEKVMIKNIATNCASRLIFEWGSISIKELTLDEIIINPGMGHLLE